MIPRLVFPSSTRRICAAGIAVFFATTTAPQALAQNNLWTGATDALWDTGANWSLGAEPTAADNVVFPSPIPTTGGVITLTTGELANSLTFQESYTLTGGNLTLTSGGGGNVAVDGAFTATAGTILAGTGGLTKTGSGTLLVTADPSITGGFTINEGTIALQHTGSTDGPFTINSGGTLRVLTANDLGDAHSITVNPGGTFDLQANDTIGQLLGDGTVVNNGAAVATLTVNSANLPPTPFNGSIQNGTSALNFTKGGANTVTLTGANQFTGTLLVNNGMLVISGPLASVATPTVNIGDNNGGSESATFGSPEDVLPGGTNRIVDNANVTVNGSSIGGLTYVGPAAGSASKEEVIGTLTISNGRNNVTLVPGNGNDVQLTAGSLARANNGTVLFRGDNLGGTGVGSTRLVFANAPVLTGGGGPDGAPTRSIINFALGGFGATSGGTDFVTYDPVAGVRMLQPSEYASTIAGAVPQRNVSVGAAGEVVSGSSTVNSLRITDNGTVSIGAGRDLNISGGSILFSGNGSTNAGSITGPGTLDFGNTEGIIHLAQNGFATTASINAPISGAAGLTYGRSGDVINILELGGDNTLTGTLRINQGTIRLTSPLALNNEYPLTVIGRASSAVQLGGNSVVVRDLQATAGTLAFSNTANTAATLTTYLTAARTFSSVLANGTGTGALNLVVSGGQTLTIDQDASATGSAEVRLGTVALSGTGGTLNDFTSYAVRGGTLRLTNTSAAANVNRLSNTAPIALNAGTLDFDNNASAANFSETVGSVTIDFGSSFITVDRAATGQTSTLTLGSLFRGAGGALVFNSQSVGAADFNLGADARARLVVSSPPALDDGIIGGWAVVQTSATAREFAKYVNSGTISVRALEAADYTNVLNSGANPAQNVQLLASPAAPLTSNTQINSLTLNQTADTTVDLGAGRTLRVESGGITVNNNFTANIVNGTLTAGTGVSAGELVIHTVGAATNPVVIDSVIANNGTGVVTLTKAGAGVLDLQGSSNTYSGKTYLSGGTLRIDADANLGTPPAAPAFGHLTFATGTQTLEVTESMTLNANRSLLVGPGSTIISVASGVAGAGKVLTYNGTIAGVAEGNLTFQSNATAAAPDTGKVNAVLTAPVNLGGTLRLEAGSMTSGNGTSVIGRSLQIGLNGVATYTQGAGTLSIGAGINDTLDIGVSGADSVTKNGALNLTGTTSFNAKVDQVRIGAVTGGAAGSLARGNATLAFNNTISAGTQFIVGDSATIGMNGANLVSTVVFGNGTNSVTTPLMTIGGRKGQGTVTLPASGSLDLRGFGANTLDLFVGRNNVGTGTVNVGVFNVDGTLRADLETLTLGIRTTGTAQNGGSLGTLNLSANPHAIAVGSVLVGSLDGASTATTAVAQGVLNQAGGQLTILNDLTLSSLTGLDGGARGQLNLTGGTISVGGNILKGGDNAARSSAVINLAGGALDLTGGSLVASQLAFRSGSLTNVGFASLDGVAVTVTGVTPSPVSYSVGAEADALILRDVTTAFPITLAGQVAGAGGISYEAAGGGAGGLISGALDLGGVARTVTVGDSANATTDLRITGAIAGAAALTKAGSGHLRISGVQAYPALVATAGTTTLASGVGAGNATVTVGAATVIAERSQTLGALNIDAGGVFQIGQAQPGPVFAGENELLAAPIQAVPEPGAAGLLAAGFAMLFGLRSRR